MVHEILPVGPLQCNCSIFGDETSGEALVIDPGDEVERIQEALVRRGLKVKAIVVTHAHLDHVGGAQKLKASTGAPVYMNAADRQLLASLDVQALWLGMRAPEKPDIDVDAREGEAVRLGGAEFRMLHTPGHTPGSISLWIPAEGKVIAGDTLFRDSIGRTDLPGGNGRQILASIRDKLLALPEETLVFPGHGDETTIGREKEFNYFLQNL